MADNFNVLDYETPRLTGYTLTYSTTEKTNAALTQAAVATTGATNITPYGFTTAAQADALIAAVNAARVDIADIKQLLTAVIDDLNG